MFTNEVKKKKNKVEEESNFASKIQSSFEQIADAMKECTKVTFVYKYVLDLCLLIINW